MQPLVMDEKLYEELKGDYSYRDAMELLDNINNAIKLGNIENVSQLTEELFLHRLKYAFDFSLCRDVIGEIKRLVYRYSTIYDLGLEEEAVALNIEEHATIEELYARVNRLLMICVRTTAEGERVIGHLSQQAIRYIKEHCLLKTKCFIGFWGY